jgi:transcriptional regulator with XRE-family HTH domain
VIVRRNIVAKAFGRVLREARRYRELSQEDLAADAELDRTYPSLLERGLRTPTLTVLFVLAKILRTTVASLAAKTAEELANLLNLESVSPTLGKLLRRFVEQRLKRFNAFIG